MRRMAIVLAGVLVLGCGGGTRKAETTPDVDDEETGEAGGEAGEVQGGAFVAPERLDEIQRTFERKRPVVARCYEDAVASGAVKKSAKGRVRLVMTIMADGQARNIKVTENTFASSELGECIVGLVASWDLPEPGARTEFSFAYDFEPE